MLSRITSRFRRSRKPLSPEDLRALGDHQRDFHRLHPNTGPDVRRASQQQGIEY